MKISLDKDSKLKKKYKIVVSKNESNESFSKLLNEKLPTLKIDGFRKGHVPVETAKQHFGDRLFKQVVSDFMDSAAKQIIDENKFTLATSPALEAGGEIAQDKDFSFFLIFELWPTVSEVKYNKISVTKPIVELTEKEIEEQILVMAERLAKLEKIEDIEHKSQKGNVLDIDYLGKIDDIAFKGGTAKNQMLELGSNAFIPGFEDQLIGYKAGSEVIVNVIFPEEYHSEEVKGKKAAFEVKINNIHKKVMPEINDNFAKEFESETLAALKEKIKIKAKEEYDDALKSILRKRIIAQIGDEADFDLPESILEKEIEAQRKSLEESNKDKPEKEKLSEKEINKKAAENAEKRLRVAYLKNHWIDQYKITVNDDDFRNEMIKEAVQSGNSLQSIMGVYNQYPQLKQYVLSAIEERKIFDEVFKLLKIKEKEMNKADADVYLEKLKLTEEIL